MEAVEFEKVISEKRNMERILENLSEGIIAHDKKRRIIYFNRRAEEITGYKREDVLGRDCHKAFGGPFCGGRCSFQEGTPADLDRLSYPLNILTRNDEPRRLEMEVLGMKDSARHFVGIIAAFRDVTDLIGLRINTGALKGFAGIIGRDPKMLEVYSQIRNLATSDYPVHITGETGTGKELVANAIHNESRRGGKPFVAINCGALPEGVLESELFGHVRGAFTGAHRDKKGRFELAHGGTIFLDEVADLPKQAQAKLLRVLQESTIERLGDEKTIAVDVRIISATNRDLKEEVRKKHFREDLYYRINVVPLNLPPLRDRRGDIPLLAEHFLRKAAKNDQETLGFSKGAFNIMMAYAWPGNVRELQSAVHFALVHCNGAIIKRRHLPLELKNWKTGSGTKRGSKLGPEAVKNALMQAGGNKAKASRMLGVGRATLYRFLAANQDVS